MLSLESESPGEKPIRQFKTEGELRRALDAGVGSKEFEEAFEFMSENHKLMMRDLGIKDPFVLDKEEIEHRQQQYDYLIVNTKVVQAFIPVAQSLSGSDHGYDAALYQPKKEIIHSRMPMQVSLVWGFEEENISDWRYKLLKIPPHRKMSWNEINARVVYQNTIIEGISINGSYPIAHDQIKDLNHHVNLAVKNPLQRSYIVGASDALPDPRIRAFQDHILFQFRSVDAELKDKEI